jgi:hypothetical protein
VLDVLSLPAAALPDADDEALADVSAAYARDQLGHRPAGRPVPAQTKHGFFWYEVLCACARRAATFRCSSASTHDWGGIAAWTTGVASPSLSARWSTTLVPSQLAQIVAR